MKGKRYEARAILRDDTHEWEVTIYEYYESMDEALRGVCRFLTHGYDVVNVCVNERMKMEE